VRIDAPQGELLGEDAGGAVFLVAELGMGVEVAADLLQLGPIFADVLDWTAHGCLRRGGKRAIGAQAMLPIPPVAVIAARARGAAARPGR